MTWNIYADIEENRPFGKIGATVSTKNEAIQIMDTLARCHVNSWAVPTLTHTEQVQLWYEIRNTGTSDTFKHKGLVKAYNRPLKTVPLKIYKMDDLKGGHFIVDADF